MSEATTTTTEPGRAEPLRWRIGDITVTSITEIEGPAPARFLYDGVSADDVLAVDWLRPHFATDEGRLLTKVQALAVETPDALVIVDTCVGNDKERPVPNWDHLDLPFLDDLAAAGIDRHAVDIVVCTHLHVDHVGWNTMLVDGSWVPTFPNARYVFVRTELEHWQKEDSGMGPVFEDSVRPILDAGLADLVEADHEVCAGVTLESTPGHTPGHVAVRITDPATTAEPAATAVITGDLAHHPIQVARPELASRFDHDPDLGRATRRGFIERYADTGTLVIGTHFAGPTAGYLTSHDDGNTAHAGWRFGPER
ncbi:MAG: MBL fold metallo-hydrolase [Actinomycetota bacterium]|nr:MBL fold metallo-hydrolase [Actinomycetota bacterium]